MSNAVNAFLNVTGKVKVHHVFDVGGYPVHEQQTRGKGMWGKERERERKRERMVRSDKTLHFTPVIQNLLCEHFTKLQNLLSFVPLNRFQIQLMAKWTAELDF